MIDKLKVFGIIALATLVLLVHVVGVAVLIGENDRNPEVIARKSAASLSTVLD